MKVRPTLKEVILWLTLALLIVLNLWALSVLWGIARLVWWFMTITT